MAHRSASPQLTRPPEVGEVRPALSRGQVAGVMAGVMLAMLLAALDQTVVAPAMFRIVQDLLGLEHYAWVTTAYLLTSTVTVPIAGKLGDLHGRKWYFVGGVGVFMAGSALAGLARGTAPFTLLGLGVSGLTVGMAQLILFRGLQGIGGGFIFANAFTIVGDLVQPRDRARWQGLFGTVWGLASVVGPTVGGYITDHVGWQWVFYVNVPVGILALAVVVFLFPRLVPLVRPGARIDWWGAAALVGATVPLLLALSLGGTRGFAWGSPTTLGLFGFSAALTAVFVLIETRVAEPLIAPRLFASRTFTLSMVTVLLFGFALFGALVNIPLFIQGVQGDTATSSGNAVTPMLLASVVMSIIAGQVVGRTGRYRVFAILGPLSAAAGMYLLSTMAVDTPRWHTVAYTLLIGAGLGVAMPLYTLIVQNAFPPYQMGVVTSATTFFRSVGATVGVAVLGSVVNSRFSGDYSARLPEAVRTNPQLSEFLADLSPQALVSPETLATIRTGLEQAGVPALRIAEVLDGIRGPIAPALSAATTEAFLIAAIALAVAVAASAFIPEVPLRKSETPQRQTASSAPRTSNPEPANVAL